MSPESSTPVPDSPPRSGDGRETPGTGPDGQETAAGPETTTAGPETAAGPASPETRPEDPPPVQDAGHGGTRQVPGEAALTAHAPVSAGPPEAGRPVRHDDHAGRFGVPGLPVSRNNPFYVGFVGTIGVLTAWFLLKQFTRLSPLLILIAVSLFLALSLDQLVQTLQRRGLSRRVSVTIVLVGAVGLFSGFVSAISPLLVQQGTELIEATPELLGRLQESKMFQRLDHEYGIVSQASTEIQNRLATGDTAVQLFGGIFGAGKALVSGIFSAFTVLVLTLYFLASLHAIADAGYRLVPASRRERVRLLGDEIIRRIGGYVAGQIGVASINGFFTFILVSICGLPYSVVLAITVALLGLIPMIGATLGALVVIIVALFSSWKLAVGIAIYYVVYQQIENYVVMPKIMAKTVSVPGSVAVVAALAGGALLGVLGALVAIPLAAGALLIVHEVLVPRQDRC